MSIGCLDKKCMDCEFAVMKGDRLECNYGNRLGLGKPELSDYMPREDK